jgi:hypothetical protein
MIVHLHATCWNEGRLLPFFFRHYDKFVDRYFIHDNQSTDASLDILAAHPRVTILPLTLDGDSYVQAMVPAMNRMWQVSRGQADWVAVVNVDEFFWHPDMAAYLRRCRLAGITWLESIGFQMIATRFPEEGENLARNIRQGMRSTTYDKPAFFNPNAIEGSGFGLARHIAAPIGRIVRAARQEILLLHYKHLGLEYVLARANELGPRRRAGDRAAGYGVQYDHGRAFADHTLILARSVEVVPPPARWKRLAAVSLANVKKA